MGGGGLWHPESPPTSPHPLTLLVSLDSELYSREMSPRCLFVFFFSSFVCQYRPTMNYPRQTTLTVFSTYLCHLIVCASCVHLRHRESRTPFPGKGGYRAFECISCNHHGFCSQCCPFMDWGVTSSVTCCYLRVLLDVEVPHACATCQHAPEPRSESNEFEAVGSFLTPAKHS